MIKKNGIVYASYAHEENENLQKLIVKCFVLNLYVLFSTKIIDFYLLE